jgi:hypothetical protein
MKIELTDYSAKRNREQSPLLRLPAELRNQIYQYTLSGYVIQPHTRGQKGSKNREILTYCGPAPGTTHIRPEDNLWLLVQSLSRSSRQLHAEIGEMLFTESIIYCYSHTWYEWLGCLSEKRKASIEKVQVWTPISWSGAVNHLFKSLDLLPNIKTLYVRTGLTRSESWVKEMIVHEAQRRGLEVFFKHYLDY